MSNTEKELPKHVKEALGIHLIERVKYLKELNSIDHQIYKAEREKNSILNDLEQFDSDFRGKFVADMPDLRWFEHYMNELYRFMQVSLNRP